MKKAFYILFFTATFQLFAQEDSYTLSKCIDIAAQNNINLQSTRLKAESSHVNLKQSWGDIMPSLNADYSLGITNGRSIDPFTNDYINQQLTFSNAGLRLSAPIFNGFKLQNSIKQSRFNLKASEMEVEEARQTMILNVTLAYLQILNARDLLELAKARTEVTGKQVDRLEVLYKEEVGNPADYTDMRGQFSSDKMAVINAQNSLNEAIIALFRLLGIETNLEAVFEDIEVSTTLDEYGLSADEVYSESLANLATFKAKEFRLNAAQKGMKAARGNYTPLVSVFGQVNTNYSSAAQTFNETGSQVVETGDFVDVAGQNYPVLTNQTLFEAEKISYKDQFDNNLNSTLGVSVTIPLFNGFNTKYDVALKKIQVEEAEVDLKNTKLLYKQSIEQAYYNMEAAFNRYHLLEQQTTAFEESFRINEIRFNSGVSNVVEYITSKNNLDSARLNLANALYEYTLRVKVLDYYRGLN